MPRTTLIGVADEKLRVPAADVPVLQRLAGLSNASAKALAEAVAQHTAVSRAHLIAEMSEGSGQPRDVVEPILNTALSIEQLRSASGWTVEEVQRRLENADRVPGKTRAERRALVGRVAALLGHRSLRLLSSAYFTMLANERTFRSAEIQTEVRPVFIEGENEPGAVLVVHQLEIAFHRRPSGEVRTDIFALDDGDLNLLAEAVQSARKRASATRKMLGPAGVPFALPLDSEGEE